MVGFDAQLVVGVAERQPHLLVLQVLQRGEGLGVGSWSLVLRGWGLGVTVQGKGLGLRG